MDTSNIALFAIFGAVAAFWQQVKGFVSTASSFVIRQDCIESNGAMYAFFKHYEKNIKIIRFGNRNIQETKVWVPRLKYSLPFFFNKDSRLLILFSGVPIFISPHSFGIKFTYLYGTFNFNRVANTLGELIQNDYCSQLEADKNKYNTQGFFVRDIFGTLNSEMKMRQPENATIDYDSPAQSPSGQPPSSQHFEVCALKSFVECYGSHHYQISMERSEEDDKPSSFFWSQEAQKLLGEMEFWLENRKWYQDREIRWRRGALLFGKAGGGKSKIVEECAKKLRLPVFKFNVGSMTDEDFIKKYKADYLDGQIILIEDVDVHYNMRENKSESKSIGAKMVSFDTIINAIGGIKSAESIFTVMTTNHVEGLDPALIRAGRLDAKIEVGPLCKDGREHIAKNVLRDWPLLIDRAVNECDNIVAAEFENYCIELAISEKNKEKQ